MIDGRTPVIVAARRTPIGTAGLALRDVDVVDLAAPALRATADDAHLLAPSQVVLGNCMGPGGNVARVASLAAGFDVSTPAMTVDLQCGSGLAAITTACALIRSGSADTVLAGGAESASTAPWRHWPPAEGVEPQRYSRAPFAPAEIGDPEMGAAADNVARRWGITRERQDAYAVRSHSRASAARAAGLFDDELVPLPQLATDQRVRANLTTGTLSRLPAAFSPEGTVTAGNACGINDGAAVVAMVTEAQRRADGIPGLACLDWATVGSDPNLPGVGPVPAVRTLLHRNSVTLDDIGVIEINEAFAAQVLACCDELGIDEERVCIDGGALALGHPWGASGAVLAVRLFGQMLRADGPELGLATIAVGGGQGVALLVRRVG
ncbi:putative acetyl-coa acyltransferase protein [Janibacter sp. HTCC2649]|uniref:thiolase family protein n=1 Tax=Janibacter sp. HTCC2649 TaxID=313589 RepID=UPI000066EC15|nr:thiolase family protein [Janibacter sp. HTCC2649]EAP98951.1 putative acetyl-coa acyltransferase protein [Janibacter sp. HTCC2649]